MRKISITVALLSLFSLSKAQTNTTQPSDPALNALEKPRGTNNFVKIKVTESYNTTGTENQKSDYNNWEIEILKGLNTDYIPKDFPIYNSSMTSEEYKSLINTWAQENPSYLKQPK